MKKILSTFIFLFSLLFVSPVFAGGGPIYIDVGSTIAGWNDGDIRQMIATVHLHPDVPCVGTKITFKYEDQKDGDYSPTTGDSGNTYTIKEVGARWLNGKSVYDCGTYAKYVSKNRELKYAIIEVEVPNGKTYYGDSNNRKVALNFQSNEPVQTSDIFPWDNQQDSNSDSDSTLPSKINVYVGKQIYNGGPKRTIGLSWNQVYQATKYNAYVRLSDQQEYGDGLFEKDGTESLYGQISINAYLDYFVKVEAYNINTKGTGTFSPEVFIPAMKKDGGSDESQWKIDLWLLNQKFIEPNYREVVVKWSALESALSYDIQSRSVKSNGWEQQLSGQGGPSAILKLNADEDYYIKVENCKNKIGKCIDSKELFLSKLINEEGKMISQTPNPEISQAPNEDNTKVNELNTKVDNLQNQLAETQQKQSSLEKNFAAILAWIKSIFPFFK